LSRWNDGLLLVDKEAGCTSHDVVQRARKLLGQKKIGHCGTLDPDATGLLLLTCGNATRLTRFLIRAPKVYTGVLRLGIATDTYDASGTTVSEGATDDVTLTGIEAGMRELTGTYQQSPPPYSAKKVGGVRFYEMARRGEAVPETSKEITVFEFAPRGEGLHDNRLAFTLSCTSGTYARTLAHELGRRLGCGGHLAALRRERIGPFAVEQALLLAQIATRVQENGDLGEAWVDFDRIALPCSEVTVDAQQEGRIAHGQTVLVRALAAEEGDWIKIVSQRGRFLAVGTVVENIGGGQVGVVAPKVVFQ
jgi:tRNA pseudouridine55 synthase